MSYPKRGTTLIRDEEDESRESWSFGEGEDDERDIERFFWEQPLIKACVGGWRSPFLK